MRQADLSQLELLSRIDRLIERCDAWPSSASAWEPARQARLFLQRVLPRVRSVRERLEMPLVVAMFGGTGTGKSTLVNALLGREVTRSGRQRPTTLQPQLLVHPQMNLELLQLPLEDCEIQCHDLPLLEDLVIVDCPDPDTTEQADFASNLERLRRFLPHCDVLIYTSTQQKYRSANVQRELRDAAAGCKLVFVQTHADRDIDIRDDWRQHLSREYEIPELFFVDSVGGLQQELAGQPNSGELARLRQFLLQQLASSQRGSIRRENVLDLLYASLIRIEAQLREKLPAVRQVQAELEGKTRELQTRLSGKLQEDLLSARQLWERRLIEAVVKRWGSSPFSWLLRVHGGLGALLGSLGLLRARTTAQVALLGVSQGMRLWREHQREQDFHLLIDQLDELNITEQDLTGQWLVLGGYARTAGFDVTGLGPARPDRTQPAAGTSFQEEFFQDARREVNLAVERLAVRNSGPIIRACYDLLFLVFPGFLLYRIGKNFFWDSLFQQASILSADFYLPAGIFLLLWCGLFLLLFTRRLNRGLRREVKQLVERLLARKFRHDLFPELRAQTDLAGQQYASLEELIEECHALRLEPATHSALGAPRRMDSLAAEPA